VIMGVLADDLTGAVETAGMLVQSGASVSFVTGVDGVADAAMADVIVVALHSRVAPLPDAVAAFRRAGKALLSRGARQLFYKYCATFDSTPEGNIGPCTDVLRELAGAKNTLFCPTFPEPERTVYRGHLFVGDVLLSDSVKRFDPLTPMTESNLLKVLQPQTTAGVGLVRLQDVAAGAQAISAKVAALQGRDLPYAIVDALCHADLRSIAEATVEWPLMTGGSSIAAHYPPLWRERGWSKPGRPAGRRHHDGPVVVLAGSCSDRTREQARVFERVHPVLRIDVLDPDPVEAVVDRALAWLKAQAKGPVCFMTSGDPEAVATAQAVLGRDGGARRAEQILSLIAARAVARGVSRLIVAGGETSGAVVKALGIRELSVAAYTSLGVGVCFAEQPRPVVLCLKSGKLGADDLFLTALESVEHDDA
jgi:3-dehydrotetronate 4-kinase